MSKQTIEVDGWKLTINLYDFIAGLTGDQRAQIIDALACSDEVINEVTNQIIEGWTTLGSHAARGSGGDPQSTYGIDGARMRIAKASSEIAAREIEAAGKRIESERQHGQKGWDLYHELLSRGRL